MSKLLKIAFWGLGSIAKRHIRNLCFILDAKKIEYSIDIYRHTKSEIEDIDISRCVNGVYVEEDVKINGVNYDIIFITNPTALHFKAIKECSNYTKSIFVEKPVFEAMRDIDDIFIEKQPICYVACPLRYTSVLQWIRENVDFNEVISARAICSSYLPDWRPGKDYRTTYSAEKELGGGVAIDLIHEWDYLIWLMGMPNHVYYAGGKYSDLEIHSDDLATYIGVYDKRIVELHLDYFGRSKKRELLLYTDKDVICADFYNSTIKFLKTGTVIDFAEERDEFQQKELLHFLDIICGGCENDSTIEQALDVLRIAKGVN